MSQHNVLETQALVLKRLLNEHQLLLKDLCQVTVQTRGPGKGKPYSATVISHLMNHGIWPVRTDRQDLIMQITTFLADNNVPEKQIRQAFMPDEDAGDLGVPRRTHQLIRPRHTQTVGAIEVGASPSRYTSRSSNPFSHPEFDLPETEMLSPEAKKLFRLFRDPFIDDVQGPDDVFLSSDQIYIRESMYQTARHGGFLAVVGESGAGKTTLRRDLIDRIAREDAPIACIQPRIIDKGRLTAGAICDAIIGDISHEVPKRSLEAKARQIERLLTGSSRAGNHHVLMIEEAHDLSVATLKYLKRFWELEDGFRKLLSIILIGQPELKNKLDERQNWEAREVIRRCEIAELKPLNGNLQEYLKLKFEHPRIGAKLDSIFDKDAFDAIHDKLTVHHRGTDQILSMAQPLVVNNVVRKAMNTAAEFGLHKVSAEIIREM